MGIGGSGFWGSVSREVHLGIQVGALEQEDPKDAQAPAFLRLEGSGSSALSAACEGPLTHRPHLRHGEDGAFMSDTGRLRVYPAQKITSGCLRVVGQDAQLSNPLTRGVCAENAGMPSSSRC